MLEFFINEIISEEEVMPKKKKVSKKKPVSKKVSSRKPVKKVAKKATKKKVAKKAVASKKKKVVKPKKATKKKVIKKAAAKKKVVKKTAAKKKVVKQKKAKKPVAKKSKAKSVVKKVTPKAKPIKKTKKESKSRKKPAKIINPVDMEVDFDKNIHKDGPMIAVSVAQEFEVEDMVSSANVNTAAGSVGGFVPYQPKPGEAFMSSQQVEHFRNILLGWKSQLMQEVDSTVVHMKEEVMSFPDPLDRAAQEEGFSLELRTRDRERKLLKKIEKALNLLDSGDYGYCEDCGADIGVRRLEARPTAEKCIDCKTFEEIREKQSGG